MCLAEASLPFLPPDVFLFLSSFEHHPRPHFVISFLDNGSGYHVAFSAQLSPFWVSLAMIVKTYFLNDFFIMKFFTPSFTVISCDAVSEAQTSPRAFQILPDLTPTCMVHGESELFSFRLSQVLPCSLSVPDSAHLRFLPFFLQCLPHPRCRTTFYPSFKPRHCLTYSWSDRVTHAPMNSSSSE